MIKEELLLSLLENVYKKELMLTANQPTKKFESLKILTFLKRENKKIVGMMGK